MKKIFTIIFFLVSFNGIAQSTFQKVIGGGANDAGNAIIQTSDGGYATVGYTNSFSASSEVYVVKLDASGNVQWTKTIGGSGSDGGNSIVQTSDGGYAIAGYTNSFGSGGSDVFVVKLDGSGNIQWAKTIGGSNSEYGRSIVQTSDGGYAITGNIDYNVTSGDIYVVKLDSTGNLLWTKIIAENAIDTGYSIIQASDGGYAIAGLTANFSGDSVYVLKLDGSGNIQWTKTIGGADNDWGNAIIQTSDGGYAVCGRTGLDSQWSYDTYVVKFSSTGTVLWTRTIYGNWTEAGYALAQNTDNSLTVCGYTDSYGGPGAMDFYLVKLSASGNLIWTRSIGTTFNDQGYSIACTSDGGYALCGSVYYFDNTTDMLIIKTDANGNTCGNNGTVGITSTYGTEGSGGTASSGGVVTNVTPLEGSGGVDSMLCSNFPTTINDDSFGENIIWLSPNPATTTIFIERNTANTPATLQLLDCFGRKVEEIKIAAGEKRAGINVKSFAAGIYFVRLADEKELVVSKVVVQH